MAKCEWLDDTVITDTSFEHPLREPWAAFDDCLKRIVSRPFRALAVERVAHTFLSPAVRAIDSIRLVSRVAEPSVHRRFSPLKPSVEREIERAREIERKRGRRAGREREREKRREERSCPVLFIMRGEISRARARK